MLELMAADYPRKYQEYMDVLEEREFQTALKKKIMESRSMAGAWVSTTGVAMAGLVPTGVACRMEGRGGTGRRGGEGQRVGGDASFKGLMLCDGPHCCRVCRRVSTTSTASSEMLCRGRWSTIPASWSREDRGVSTWTPRPG